MARARTALFSAALALLHCQSTDATPILEPGPDAGSDAPAASLPDAPLDSFAPDGPLESGPGDAGPPEAGDAAPPFRCAPRAGPPGPAKVRVEVLATGLKSPWSLAFLPNRDLLFTERDGNLRLYRSNGTLEPLPIPGGPATVNAYQGGYLGIALHPDLAQRPYLYLAYARAYPADGTVGLRISRFRWERERLSDETPLLDGPHEEAVVGNAGGRLAFGPDKHLYATLGDRHNEVQTLENLYGKIVRLTDDGRIPSDNPFAPATDAGVRKETFSYGHRNPQGLAFRPGTRELYASEHGDTDGDEVNRIEPGKNYGYPLIVQDASAPGLVSPLIDFTPGIAPSGMSFYASNTIPEWCGDLFVAGLVGQQLARIHFPPGGAPPVLLESLFPSELGRLRDVAQGPDGYLYFVEDHPTNARLFRVVPE